MRKLLLLVCCVCCGSALTPTTVVAQNGTATKPKMTAAQIDQMGERMFATADENHDKSLSSKEFQRSEKLIDNAINKMRSNGQLGRGPAQASANSNGKNASGKNANGKNANGKNNAAKGTVAKNADPQATAKSLSQSDMVTEGEFVRYFHSRIDSAEQQIQQDQQAQQQAQQRAQQQQQKNMQQQQRNAAQRQMNNAQRQMYNNQRQLINAEQRALRGR